MSVKIDLSNKNAVIFGGGRGLGREIAKTIAEAGANVFIGNRSEDEGKETAKALKEMGVKAGFYSADISKDEKVEEFFKEAEKFYPEGIDIVIQNAGIIATEDLLDLDGSDAMKVYEVNAIGTGNVLKHALDHMIENKNGKIVTIASIAGQTSMGMLEHYSATKAAVISLTKNASKIAAPYHINVNGISPGIIRTEMWEEILDDLDGESSGKSRDEVFDEKVKEIIPFGVPQTEQDIANAALFLVSDLSKEITGVIISVDGGTSA